MSRSQKLKSPSGDASSIRHPSPSADTTGNGGFFGSSANIQMSSRNAAASSLASAAATGTGSSSVSSSLSNAIANNNASKGPLLLAALPKDDEDDDDVDARLKGSTDASASGSASAAAAAAAASTMALFPLPSASSASTTSSSSSSSSSSASRSSFSDIDRPARPPLNVSPPYVVADESQHQMDLNVYCFTWNLHAKPWPADLSAFLPLGFDLYVVATQECMQSLEASFIYSDKSKWRDSISARLNRSAQYRADEDEIVASNDDYLLVAEQTLQALHICVFIRGSLHYMCNLISNASVATGIGGIIGNKGGVGIAMDIGQTSFLFVASHFHASQFGIEERNEDYRQIEKRLALRAAAPAILSDGSIIGVNNENVSSRFERVFWLGDLNYRIHMPRNICEKLLTTPDSIDVLLANDQLNMQRYGKLVFNSFIEGEIKFPPTYKYDTGTDTFDTSPKQRVPSWTDRILWKPCDAIELLAYESNRTVKTSDHRAVYAIFRVRIQKIKPNTKKAVKVPIAMPVKTTPTVNGIQSNAATANSSSTSAPSSATPALHTEADSTVCAMQ